MVILGIIVGLITVTAKEVTPFLIAAIALAVIIAVKQIYGIAKEK